MTNDLVALLVSFVLMVLIAAWVPFLDSCAGCVERRRRRRAAVTAQASTLRAETSSDLSREQAV